MSSESGDQSHRATEATAIMAHSPRRQTRDLTLNDDSDMFSPTSAAALALSTLQHFGADRSNSNTKTRTLISLRGTRLFNTSTTPSNATASKTSGGGHTFKYEPLPSSSKTTKVEASTGVPASDQGSFSSSPPLLAAPYHNATSNSNYRHAGSSTHVWQPHPKHHQPPTSQQMPSPTMTLYDPRYPVPVPCGSSAPRNSGNNQMYSQLASRDGYHHLQHFHSCSSTSTYPEQHQRRTYYPETQHQHQAWRSQVPSTPAATTHHAAACVSHPYPKPVAVASSSAAVSNLYSSHNMYHSSYPHPSTEQDRADKPLARLASCATTLVTPTPKKQKPSSMVPATIASSTALPQPPRTSTSASSTTTMNPSTGSASSVASVGTGYSRKKKSLGVLAENFIRQYQDFPADGSTEIIVDEAAVQLGVERRRIYDVVNILEAIGLVSKKHKNTYAWLGTHPDHLTKVFGRLQTLAISSYPEDARTLLFEAVSRTDNQENEKRVQSVNEGPHKPMVHSAGDTHACNKSRENKSLAKLSQEFLSVFLVGHEILSLPEASDKIQGTTSVEELIAMGMVNQNNHVHSSTTCAVVEQKHEAATSPYTRAQSETLIMEMHQRERKAAAARGLKTKIRRLYDIANVFLSVGLLRKVESGDSSRRPNFAWAYPWSAKQLYHLQQQREQQQISGVHHSTAPKSHLCEAKTSHEVRQPLGDWQESDQFGQLEKSGMMVPTANGSPRS